MKNIIAHRGVFDNKNIAENSIKAFKEAIKLKYDIEFDVQLTKDEKLVVFHDDNLFRMTGVNKNICDCTYDEIKKLSLLDTNQHIPTLNEVLETINDKVFMDIEIKGNKKIKIICDLIIKELSNYHNYSLKSFNPKISRYLKKNYNNEKTGYLINNKYDNKILNYILPTKFMIKYSKCDFISINKKLLKNNKFLELTKLYPTQIWTITDKSEILNEEYTYICNNIKK